MRHHLRSTLACAILACPGPCLAVGQVSQTAGSPVADSAGLEQFRGKFSVTTHVDSLPVPLHRVEPVYPDSARVHGVTGTVVIEVLIGADGRVHGARVVRSIPTLDSVAVVAVRQWTFRPAIDDRGKAVPLWIPVSIEFPPLDVPALPNRRLLFVPEPEEAGFVVELFPPNQVAVGRALEVSVVVSGLSNKGNVANVRLTTQGGLMWTDEDASVSVPLVGLVRPHSVLLRRRGTGDGVLFARATVEQKGSEQAVAEVAPPIRAHGDTLAAGPRSYYRTEHVVDGQRYRVSSPWWVPIDAPEEIAPPDATAPPTKPAVLRSRVAHCRDCDASVRRVPLIVVIDGAGVVREMKLADNRISPAASEAAMTAVRQSWTFRPGRIGRTPVTDGIEVSVPIEAGPH